MSADTEIYREQGLLDVSYEYPIGSDRSNFAIRPGLTRLGLQVNVTMRFLPPDNPERAFDVHADVGIVDLIRTGGTPLSCSLGKDSSTFSAG